MGSSEGVSECSGLVWCSNCFIFENLRKAKFHTLSICETSKYQTSLYRLSKNHWVIALFEISGSVRRKYLGKQVTETPKLGLKLKIFARL